MLKKLAWLPVASLISACSPLGIVNTVSNIYQVPEHHNIAYGELHRQALDLYLPPEKSGDTTQVILFFYGGSWNSGSRQEYRFVGRRLASEGYIVAVADYRLYPEVKYPDFLKDSAAAVNKVHQLIGSELLADYQPASRMTLMGHSAGAYNAAMLALDSRWLSAEGLDREQTINGWIGIAGPYDLYPITIEEVKPVFHHPDYPADSNPVDFIEHAVVPALILVPEEDDLVNPERNSRTLARLLQENNKPVDLTEISSTSHTTIIGTMSPVLFFKGSTLAPIQTFLDRLKE